MIVVVDTSVWVSALHFAFMRGKPRQALLKAARDCNIGLCDSIEEEILRILTEKFGWTAAAVLAAMDDVLPSPTRVTISGTLHACRDPKDDMILECAVVCGARFIISGDKDLLVLDPYEGIRILTPAEFLVYGS